MRADFGPKEADFGSERANFGPKRGDFGSDRVDLGLIGLISGLKEPVLWPHGGTYRHTVFFEQRTRRGQSPVEHRGTFVCPSVRPPSTSQAWNLASQA